jgi:hypothetical protein
LTAPHIVLPFVDLVYEKDTDYILGHEGRSTWLENLGSHPIRLSSGETGMTGIKVDMKPDNQRNGNPMSQLVTRTVRKPIVLAASQPCPWRS